MNKGFMNKTLSTALALLMCVNLFPVSALNVEGTVSIGDDGTGTSQIVLDAEALQMDVTVDMFLPIAVDNSGNVYTASDATVRNNSYGPVEISAIEVTGENGWYVVPEDTEWHKLAVNTQEVAIALNDDWADENGDVTLTSDAWTVIEGNGGILPYTYDAKIPAQSYAITDQTICNVIWLIGWHEGESIPEDDVPNGGEETATFANTRIESTGLLSIPSQINGLPVTSIGEGAFEGNQDVTSLYVPSSVETIEDNAFSGASNLSDVTLSEGVETIGENAFADTAITDIELPSTLKTMKNNALNTSTLQSVSVNQTEDEFNNNDIASNAIPDTAKVTYTDTVEEEPEEPVELAEDASLNWEYTVDESTNTITLTSYKGSDTDVTVKNAYSADGANYENVVFGNGAGNYGSSPLYAKRTKITGITFEEGVKFPANSGNLFRGLEKLSTINADGVDTSEVTSMNQMFNTMDSLTELSIDGWDVSNVTDMQYMFMSSKYLKTVSLTNWKFGASVNMQMMFYSCYALESITGIEDWDVSNATNMNSIFSCCEALTDLDISGWEISDSCNIGDMFNGAKVLTSLTVKDEATKTRISQTSYFPATCTITVAS